MLLVVMLVGWMCSGLCAGLCGLFQDVAAGWLDVPHLLCCKGSDTWLRILAAEKAGLISVKIEWPEANLKVGLLIMIRSCLVSRTFWHQHRASGSGEAEGRMIIIFKLKWWARRWPAWRAVTRGCASWLLRGRG
jgi:hypothetical protein